MTPTPARMILPALLIAVGGMAAAPTRAPARAMAAEPSEATALRQLEDREMDYLGRTLATTLRPVGGPIARAAYVQRKPGQTTVAFMFLTYRPRGLAPSCTGYDAFVATYQPHLRPADGVPHSGHWSVTVDFPGAACLSPSVPLYFGPLSNASSGAAHYRVDALSAVALPGVRYLRFVYGVGPKARTRLAALPHHFYFALAPCRGISAVQAVDRPGHTLYTRTLTAQEIIGCRT